MSSETNPQPVASVSVISHHKGWRRFLPQAIVIGVVLAILIAVLIFRTVSTPGNLTTTRLLFADSKTNQLTIANTSDKQQYQLKYPLYGLPAFTAAASDGRLLVGISPGVSQEGFILSKNNKVATLSDKTIVALRSATVIKAYNQMAFSDNNTVIYVACPDTCKLISLDIQSGDTKTITDTGVKTSFLPPAYLLGLSTDRKSAFIRVIGANKLGKETSAVYQIDLSTGKTQREIKVPFDAGYAVSLSPDRESYIYWSGGYTSNIVLHVVDIASSKDSTTKWIKELLDSVPTTFSWSPDGKKVLFYSAQVNLPSGVTGPTRDTQIAYLDVSKKTVTNLQTIKDQSKAIVTYAGWLDNNTIAYNQQTSATGDFTNPENQAYKQALTSKTASKLDNRQLIAVYRY